MNISDFIIPVKDVIAEGVCFKRNGIVINDFFVTDVHVAEADAAAIGDTYIEWKD